MEVEAPQSLGDYRLLALLATGGMAEIYLAKDKNRRKAERLVVIKRIFPHLAKQQRFVDMFLDEGNIAAKLDHPNIVKIYESSREGDEYFIAMEYLEGESLGYLVKQLRMKGRALPTPLAAGIVAQVCDGLDYAHKLCDESGKPMNIVHRDVSPHNIIILYSGGVKLVDFGIAKAASKIHKTRVGTLKGKLTYISPEQYKTGEVDARSDVFSLGVVFWELLTRRRLFKRETEKDMMRATLSGTIPRVRDIQPGVSPELEAVVQKALQREADDRYQTAGEMHEAIQDALGAIGATCEPDEISVFVSAAFEERAQTKQRLLREIRAQREDQEPSDISRSEIIAPQIRDDEIEDDDDIAEMVTPTDEGDYIAEAPTANVPNPLELALARRETAPIGLPTAVWVALPLAFLVIIMIILLASADKSTKAADRSDTADQTELAAASVPATPAVAPVDSPDGGSVISDPQYSVLAVRSRPSGCRVKIDGAEIVGLTPRERITIEAGATHKITVLCKNHLRESKEVDVEAGERITLDFAPVRKREEPKAEKAPKKPEQPNERAKTASRPASKPKPKPKPGFLRLDTYPWSEIYLGDRKLGMTPLVEHQLPAGTHQLTAVNPGRSLKKSFKVTIKPGQITKMRIELTEQSSPAPVP